MTDITMQANDLLREIRAARARLTAKRDQVEQLIREIREVHGPESQALKAEVDGLEKGLVKLMKKNKTSLFEDTDQVDLDEGILLHGFDDKVTIPKNAAAEIEHYGWTEALRWGDPTVDRATVEKWPEERLAAIGATRKHNVEVFEFEIKEES